MTTPPSSAPAVTTHSSAAGPATAAPITVLPPSTTQPSTNEPSTSTADATETPTTTAETSPTATAPAEPTVVSTTVSAHVTPPSLPPAPKGTVVVLDPGHNGGNASHPAIINKLVPAGFGQMKACNTTGTATNAGYSEHAFNWNVATRLRALLQAKGVTVVMTRDSDTGVGPCVDRRAAIGNDAKAAAVVSIHGDGEAANVAGFFVMTSSHHPGGAAVTARTDALAVDLRNGMTANGFRVSNAIGADGLWARGDLGGLNLSTVPTAMIECGNMRNAAEAAAMSSAAGQQKYAEAIAAGVLGYLAG